MQYEQIKGLIKCYLSCKKPIFILQKADIHPARSRYSSCKKPIFILQEADIQKKAKGGRRNKLSIEDHLLMALEYIRAY